MSTVEAYTGKLTPVDLQGKSLDEWIQHNLKLSELPAHAEDWLEVLSEEHYNKYLYNSKTKTLYKVKRKSMDPDGFLHFDRKKDGSYTFSMSYYNGGASFEEVMRDVFD